MIRTKEFQSCKMHIDELINDWIMENPRVKIIDIKYIANIDTEFDIYSHALLIYESD